MAKRRKIGLIYQYNENWIGGTYYIENLIAALNQLSDKKKPELCIFTYKIDHFEKLKQNVKYPYLIRRDFHRDLKWWENIANKISQKLFNQNIFESFPKNIEIIFPGSNEIRFKKDQQFLYWIPDFQENFLTTFFSDEEITRRKEYQKSIVLNKKYILFSSECVKKDFNNIYPGNKMTQFVVPFAVTHGPFSTPDMIAAKYLLPQNFFICSNQFWKHKNHIVVLKAIHTLKKMGHEITVVFTGKEHDHRAPFYFSELKDCIQELGIENNTRFLGFIDRNDQLAIMKLATAVLQPSLFEGWSTVIEDGKSLGKHIIASGLDVHKEQLSKYNAATFFSALDESSLATAIIKVTSLNNYSQKDFTDYNFQILRFANSFIQVVNAINNNNK